MARDPFSWADRVSDQGFNDKQNSEQYSRNALLTLFQEEAARQRPYATMPAVLAQAQFDRQNAEQFQIAREQRALANDMALRRYYAENPIPRAGDDPDAAVFGGAATHLDPATGQTGNVFTIGGKTMVRYPDGRVEYLE
jgi:hypothetical protein